MGITETTEPEAWKEVESFLLDEDDKVLLQYLEGIPKVLQAHESKYKRDKVFWEDERNYPGDRIKLSKNERIKATLDKMLVRATINWNLYKPRSKVNSAISWIERAKIILNRPTLKEDSKLRREFLFELTQLKKDMDDVKTAGHRRAIIQQALQYEEDSNILENILTAGSQDALSKAKGKYKADLKQKYPWGQLPKSAKTYEDHYKEEYKEEYQEKYEAEYKNLCGDVGPTEKKEFLSLESDSFFERYVEVWKFDLGNGDGIWQNDVHSAHLSAIRDPKFIEYLNSL